MSNHWCLGEAPCHETFHPSDSAGQSITVACSVMLAGPALSAFAIFHSSECADVVNVPAGNGAVAEERSSRSSLDPAVAIEEIAANPIIA